ncbi:MAG TPA: pyridoxamine 5'-phosphate oxidase family protein [Gammaproteobacteria bacterium]
MSGGQRFHPGELEAQQRFNAAWDEGQAARLGRLIGEALDEEQARFVESVAFFFLATADAEGNCDCSFKGSEPGADGKAGQAVWVAGPRRLLFPDFAGNRLFNSLGNILVNSHAGLLFIDFTTQKRLRVNGMAHVLDGEGEWRERWPQAVRAVEVTVEQVYWNCSKRIPQQP